MNRSDAAQEIRLFPGRFAVARVDRSLRPELESASGFWSVTRTPDEWSIVCEESRVPDGARTESGFRLLRVAGVLDFDEIGVLRDITTPLAAAQVSVLCVSTFDTDYLLIREADLSVALGCLQEAGWKTPVND